MFVSRHIPDLDAANPDKVDPVFYTWQNNTMHRLPENFILTCVGTHEAGNVVKTPQQAYLRWNVDDYANGICPIRMCDPGDFSLRNQRKRFSDWRSLFFGWDKLLLLHGEQPLVMHLRRDATVEDWMIQFNTAFQLHCTLVKFLHPSKSKRNRMRSRPASVLTLKISTTLFDARAVAKRIKRFHVNLRRYRGLVRFQRRWKARYPTV